MASAVDIVNRGLIMLGSNPIVSFSENSKNARTANAVWEQVRDEVLREHPWNCATAMAELAAAVTAPIARWTNSYPLPSDCLRVLWLLDVQQPDEFEVNGRDLLTDFGSPIFIQYIKRETDTAKFDALLCSAISARMAAELAEPLTQSSAKKDRAISIYSGILDRARIVDGLEEAPVEPDEEDSWLSVRL